MNVSKPRFKDVRVRKAVALATDREKMSEIAVEGWGIQGGFIGPRRKTSANYSEDGVPPARRSSRRSRL
jgi:ABC-type transport system substrate-binding protein